MGSFTATTSRDYELVSQFMYEKIVKDEIGLNVETVYSYQGNNDVNEVLEDCITAVSVNSERIWVTGKPIMNDASNLAVTIQQIQPLSWIKRKLHIEPHIVCDTTFESGKATHISGTCKRFIIDVARKKLEVHTNGFDWLQ